MERRTFMTLVSGSLLAAPLIADAQQATKVWRIGWLSPPSAATGVSELNGLRDGLRELNYVEGRNIRIEARWADGNPGRLPELARALVQLKVDIICTAGTPATLAAKQATTAIPIVFGAAAFPDRTGLVASYARPGGNLTGVAFVGQEYGKRLELLREVGPTLSRVVLLYNDNNPASQQAMSETRKWADSLRVTLEPLGVHDRQSLEEAIVVMRRRLPGALMTTADPLISSYRTLIVEFTTQHRLLSMYPNRDYVPLGGLMFYGTSTTDMWRRAAIYVDRILRGAAPGELPVEQPTKFDMIINMKTAKTLGLTIPQSLLLRADEIIQ